MKISLVLTVVIAGLTAENSNWRKPRPLHMVLDDLLRAHSTSSSPYAGYLR